MKSNIPAIILAGGKSKRMGVPKALLKIGRRTLVDDQIARLAKAGCKPVIVVLGKDAKKIIPPLPPLQKGGLFIINKYAYALDTHSRSSALQGALKCVKLAQANVAQDFSPANIGRSKDLRYSKTSKVGVKCISIINKSWRLGQFSSIQCGLKSLPDHSRGCLILPIDCPFVPVGVIKKIINPPCPPFFLPADAVVAGKGGGGGIDAVIPVYKLTTDGRRPTTKKGHPIWISARLIKKILQRKTGRLDEIIARTKNIKLIPTRSRAVLNNINTMKQWLSALAPLL